MPRRPRPPAPLLASGTLIPRPREHSARSELLLSVLLLASGMAALIYQTLWVKQLALIVGVDVYAVTTALSAFFGGVAIGGALFGRLADRSARPLRVFAALEAGTG